MDSAAQTDSPPASLTDVELVIADEPTPGMSLEQALEALRMFREMADKGKAGILITSWAAAYHPAKFPLLPVSDNLQEAEQVSSFHNRLAQILPNARLYQSSAYSPPESRAALLFFMQEPPWKRLRHPISKRAPMRCVILIPRPYRRKAGTDRAVPFCPAVPNV